jgi:hypothetical protein
VRAGGGLSPEVCTLLTEANTSSILITDLGAADVELPLRVLFRPIVEEAPGASLEASAILLNSIPHPAQRSRGLCQRPTIPLHPQKGGIVPCRVVEYAQTDVSLKQNSRVCSKTRFICRLLQ